MKRWPTSIVTRVSIAAPSSSQTALTRPPRSVSATTTITSSSTSPIGNASAIIVAQAPPVWRSTAPASTCVTTAPAPSVPIATSSQNAAPKRVSRARANCSAAMNAAGKKARNSASAGDGNDAIP